MSSETSISSRSGGKRWCSSRRSTSDGQAEVEQVGRAEVDGHAEVAAAQAQAPDLVERAVEHERVSARVSPLCSTSGRKCTGPSSPRLGCSQRTSASTPRTWPERSSAFGW
jgi:hypothetical protein